MNSNITDNLYYSDVRNARDLERNADMIAGALFDFLTIGYYDFLDGGFSFEDVRAALDDLDMIHRAIAFLNDCVENGWFAYDARVIRLWICLYRLDLVNYNARW